MDYKISYRNIKATALKEFWGKEYDESIYLWEGSKHNLKFNELKSSETCKNVLSSSEEINAGNERCVNLYYKLLPQIAMILNKVNGVNLSISFWQIAFGYWLYRHICNVFEKYFRLSQLDVNKISLKLLNKKNFYIPHNHADYLFCFAHDFGVQQLVSQYYNLKSTVVKPSIEMEFISFDPQAFADIDIKKYCISLLKKIIKKYVRDVKLVRPKIALLGVGFSEDNVEKLNNISKGKIGIISLPIVFLKRNKVDMPSRLKFSTESTENEFEDYLFKTLTYCIPKDYIENFNTYFSSFKKDLERKKYSHIVSEDWISNIPNAIYIGLAKEKKCKFITYEHGFGTFFYQNDFDFIYYSAADYYLSVGWKKNVSKIIKGGFASRKIIPHNPDLNQNDILFIGRTNFLYDVELIDRNLVDPHFLLDLENIDKFIKLLPENLRQFFVFRPRPPGVYYWDTVYQLDLKKRGIKIDIGNFSKSILRSRIVVIDHIGTGIAEIILMGAPFILLYDIRKDTINKEAIDLIDEMIECGLLHLNSQSAVYHINSIYDGVQNWWTSSKVQSVLKKLKDTCISPGSKTVEYLISLLG